MNSSDGCAAGDNDAERLSQIETMWTMVRNAHGGYGTSAGSAQERLLRRYSLAVHRYLRGALRDPDAADELFQEFALRIMRGDFKRADPERGKFRRFVKTAIYHLVIDYQRRRRAQPAPIASRLPEPAAEIESPAESDASFAAAWRAELLRRAGEALADLDRKSGQRLYTVLRLRADHPESRSAELAEQFSRSFGQQVHAGWVRKRLHQAREKFADLLLDEIARSLEEAAIDELEEEVIELGLLDYCRPAIQRRRDGK